MTPRTDRDRNRRSHSGRRAKPGAGALGLAAALLALPLGIDARPAAAQGVGARPPLQQQRLQQRVPPGERGELERRVWAAFYQNVQRELNLAPDQVIGIREAIERFREPRQALLRDERELRMRTRRFIQAGAVDSTEARAILNEMARLKEREVSLFREEQRALLQVLPAAQVVRLYQRRDELVQRINAVGRRGGGPGGGPGGGLPDGSDGPFRGGPGVGGPPAGPGGGPGR